MKIFSKLKGSNWANVHVIKLILGRLATSGEVLRERHIGGVLRGRPVVASAESACARAGI